MTFHLQKTEKGTTGIRRILLEQVEKLALDLERANKAKAIHEVRKRCKRIRAVAKLLRPVAKIFSQQENRNFRDLARALSSLRDASARQATWVKLIKTEQDGMRRFSPLRSILNSTEEHLTPLSIRRKFDVIVKEAHKAEWRLRRTKLADAKTFDLIEQGLLESYKRGRKALAHAGLGDKKTAFHEWRKRVKDLGYQFQILRELWPPTLKQWHKELEKLGDLLGDEHDLVVIRQTLRGKASEDVPPELLKAFFALLDRRILELEAEAQAMGRRLYAEKPTAFMKRIKCYWGKLPWASSGTPRPRFSEI